MKGFASRVSNVSTRQVHKILNVYFVSPDEADRLLRTTAACVVMMCFFLSFTCWSLCESPNLKERGRLDEVRGHVALVLAAVVALDETNLLLGVRGRVVHDHVAVIRLDEFLLQMVEERRIVQVAPTHNAQLRVAHQSSAALRRFFDSRAAAERRGRARGKDYLGGGGRHYY